MSYTRDDQKTLNVASPMRSKEDLTRIEEPLVEQAYIDNDNDYYTRYPNAWFRIREAIQEPMAEFFGVLIMMALGTAVDCQSVLSADKSVSASPKGDYTSLAFGWACGVSLGVWLSAGISGGHLNPAITIAFATFRGFPWRKVPVYIFAQLMGALCGSGIAYANYIHAIDLYEGGRHIRTVPGTASLFSTYAVDYMTDVSVFFDEFIATVILLMVVCAFSDPRNAALPNSMLPIALFITILAEGLCMGMQTGYALNPARDLGPRMMTAMVGYGKEVFTFRHQYWLWAAIVAPIVSALFGVLLYDIFFYKGSESPINKPCAAALKAYKRAQNSSSHQREKHTTGMNAV